MSIWIFCAQVLPVIAITFDSKLASVFREGTQIGRLHAKLAATTTVPPAFLRNLAFREANLQEQIDRAKQTLQEAEWRLGNITASMSNATVALQSINNTVKSDQSLMNGTSSLIANLRTHYTRSILEGKYNNTQNQLKLLNKTAQNVSTQFGAAKGSAASTKDISATLEALKRTVLLNGSAVNQVLKNFSKMEDVLSMNVSEYIKWRVERDGEDVFRHIEAKFEVLLKNQTEALKQGRECDLVPNITECKNSTANTSKAKTFLQGTAVLQALADRKQRQGKRTEMKMPKQSQTNDHGRYLF